MLAGGVCCAAHHSLLPAILKISWEKAEYHMSRCYSEWKNGSCISEKKISWHVLEWTCDERLKWF